MDAEVGSWTLGKEFGPAERARMMRTDPESNNWRELSAPGFDSEDGFLCAHLRDKGVREA